MPALKPKFEIWATCAHEYAVESRPMESRPTKLGEQDLYIVQIRTCRVCGYKEADRLHVGTSLPWLSPNYL